MSFEKISESLARKDIDNHFDIVGFLDIAKGVIRRRSGVEVDALSYNNELLRITVTHPVEASEIRLRKIQIVREIEKKTSQTIGKFYVKVQF
jgi:hypothetical protein